jgi:hypothetical protein
MKDNKNIIIIFIVLLVIGIIVGLVLYYKGRQKYSRQISSYKPYRNEMPPILKGQWIFFSDAENTTDFRNTKFRLNLNGNPSMNYGSLVINDFIRFNVLQQTEFLNNLFIVKIDDGEIKINTDFQVIDITFYPSRNLLKTFRGRNFKPNANRVEGSESWEDSDLN